MEKYSVCKTIAAHPEKAQFVVQVKTDPHRLPAFASLEELAEALRGAAPNSMPRQEPRYIKNDVPGDIVWYPHSGDRVKGDEVVEYEKLSPGEMRKLAQLLRKS